MDRCSSDVLGCICKKKIHGYPYGRVASGSEGILCHEAHGASCSWCKRKKDRRNTVRKRPHGAGSCWYYIQGDLRCTQCAEVNMSKQPPRCWMEDRISISGLFEKGSLFSHG